MPNIDILDLLLQKIRELSPKYVISIGGTSILSNLVNKMIPVITVNLGPSNLTITTHKYQTLGRPLTEIDKAMLEQVGFNKTNVIESLFTSSLKPQTEYLTREQINLPKEGFLLAVVGARLDEEITTEFLTMLNEISIENISIAFLGIFDTFEQKLRLFPQLHKKSYNLGFCDDILSRLELCDLYVNPIRKGGGTSSVEALFKGVPVVSVNYGDVSVNVGPDFCVKDYQEMKQKILQYVNDHEYYNLMSQKAKERAKILLDTESEFIRILQEMDRREATENITP